MSKETIQRGEEGNCTKMFVAGLLRVFRVAMPWGWTRWSSHLGENPGQLRHTGTKGPGTGAGGMASTWTSGKQPERCAGNEIQ